MLICPLCESLYLFIMKKENQKRIFGFHWKSILAGVGTYFALKPIAKKMALEQVMNKPEIKKKINELTGESLELNKELLQFLKELDDGDGDEELMREIKKLEEEIRKLE